MDKHRKIIFFLVLVMFLPFGVSADLMDGDLQGIPGGGTIDASKSVAGLPLNNYSGVRMYVVDKTTGQIISKVRDFTKNMDTSASSYFYVGNTKIKNASISQISAKTYLKTGYQNMLITLDRFNGVSFPENPGGDSIKNFFKALDSLKDKEKNLYPAYDFLEEYLAVSGDIIEKLKDPELSLNYRLVVEPVTFYRIGNARYALTAVEGVQIVNEKNFSTEILRGRTIKHPFWNDGITITYDNMFLYKDCYDKIMSGTASKKIIDNCRSIRWWLASNLESHTPWAVRTEVKSTANIPEAEKIKYKHIIAGVEYKASLYSQKAYFTSSQIRSADSGLGIGFLYFSSTDNKKICPVPKDDLENCCDMLTTSELDANLSSCCDSSNAKTRPGYASTCCASKKTLTKNDLPVCCSDPRASSVTGFFPLCQPIIIPNACNYYITTKYPNDCKEESKGEINDIDDWECIFKSTTLGGTDFSAHYDEFTNRYCNIFCRQDITYDFPSSSVTVQAGNHFTIGFNQYGESSWNPIKMTENSTCKADSSGINHAKFKVDWRDSNIAVKNAWNNLQIEIAKENSFKNAISVANHESCLCINKTSNGVDCCKSDEEYCPSGNLENGECVTTVGSPVTDYVGCSGTIDPVSRKCSSCPSGYSVNGVNCKSNSQVCRNGTMSGSSCVKYSSPSYRCAPGFTDNTKETRRFPVDSYYPTENGTNYKQEAFCPNEAAANKTFTVDTLKNTYYRAVNTRDGYLTTLKQCTNYSYDHTFNPVLSVIYEEARYGGKFDLIGNPTLFKNTNLKNGETAEILSYSCLKEGSLCSESSVEYPISDNLIHTSIKTIDYTLAGNVYQYVDKITSVSDHNIAKFPEYVAIGYNNLPIDFTRYGGTYDIKINFSELGAGNKFNEFITTGKANTKRCEDSPNCVYTCEYGVENKILCNPEVEVCTDPTTELNGLNIIFRPISLSNPFPGADGGGREPGSNWGSSTSKISNNRGVKADEIYSKREPIYQITLDSKTIRAIRDDNQRNSYTDFKLKCKLGTGKECVSEFVTTLRKSYGMKISSCARSENNEWNDSCSYQ